MWRKARDGSEEEEIFIVWPGGCGIYGAVIVVGAIKEQGVVDHIPSGRKKGRGRDGVYSTYAQEEEVKV